MISRQFGACTDEFDAGPGLLGIGYLPPGTLPDTVEISVNGNEDR
jgi:hypothetical protein